MPDRLFRWYCAQVGSMRSLWLHSSTKAPSYPGMARRRQQLWKSLAAADGNTAHDPLFNIFPLLERSVTVAGPRQPPASQSMLSRQMSISCPTARSCCFAAMHVRTFFALCHGLTQSSAAVPLLLPCECSASGPG
eukprot:1173827-Amphidinium_carterae.1